jgi:Protein of unknown function (DUF2851)
VWTLSHPPSHGSSARPLLSEDELADAWQLRAYTGHYLVDCCGRHLRVVFPGRRWGGPGPDFVGAVLADATGTLMRGDVEVHVRASSWAAHRHARDRAYSGVMLHVVQVADALVLDGRGGHVPTVQLEPKPDLREAWAWALGERQAVPCVREAASVLQIVEAAGRERFRARVARFEGDLSVAEADQVVWRGVCEALGFRRNTLAFGQLADAAPWSLAAAVAADRGPVGLAGLLLGSGGLLAEATLPEAHAWRALQRSLGVRPALQRSAWDRRQVRAANTPEQRCRGLAELAARWAGAAGSGVRCGLAQQVCDQVAAAASRRWPQLWQFVRASPWIGRGRAQVIAVNVLLPFAAAAGSADAEALFERLPGEPANRVVRYMAEQLSGPGVRFRGACHQQGLLHLFKFTCAARVCERCPAWAGGEAGLATSSAGESSKD